MPYNRHNWRNKGNSGAIPLNQTNLNEMEEGIQNNSTVLDVEIVARQSMDAEHSARLNDLEEVVPAQASGNNQLADKAFVNSSITTATAFFRGTFNSVAELQAYSGEKTINDYAYVVTMVQGLADKYDRYKWNGTSWIFEYTINTSGLTAEQLAALNSGASKAKIDSIANKENTANRVNTVTASSDNTHYPTAKAVWNLFNSIAFYEGEVEVS